MPNRNPSAPLFVLSFSVVATVGPVAQAQPQGVISSTPSSRAAESVPPASSRPAAAMDDLPPESDSAVLYGTFLAQTAETSSPLEGDTLPPSTLGEPIYPLPPDDADLDTLNPDPNPLLLPTQPEEVEILGTQPITLEQAIELAYRNNESLQIARLELERSHEALREARAALLPDLDLSSDLTARNTTGTSGFSFFGDGFTGGGFTGDGFSTEEEIDTTTQSTLELSYDLYTSGRRAASIRAAEEQVRLQELALERQREQLRLDTINDYYDLQEAIEQIRINQAFLDEAERNLRDTELREEVGVGTRFDVLRAEVQAANARQQLVQARSDRRTAQRQLAQRLALPPSLEVTTEPVAVAGTWPLSLEETIVTAFQNRAELEEPLVQRTISEQQQRIARAAVGPQISLFANYSVRETFGDGDSPSDNYSLGARLRWQLYDGGAAGAQADQEERNQEIAETQFSQARNQVRLEVEQAYFSLEANRDNIDTARLAVEQAEEALELARLRFNAGVGTQLDVLSAQSDLTDAEGSLVTAILGYNRALAALQRAVSNLAATSSAP